MQTFRRVSDFYPRSPCGERLDEADGTLAALEFLSTLSLRRATLYVRRGPKETGYFYPRSPCGERLARRKAGASERNFYPRSPCGERPPFSRSGRMTRRYFYPRSPCGERQDPISSTSDIYKISIHALLAESDQPQQSVQDNSLIISIHALLAESDVRYHVSSRIFWEFLSTLSLRRATRPAQAKQPTPPSYFYPRSPCGERLLGYKIMEVV